MIGEVELVIKVARAPLPEAEQGVPVTSGVGNLIAVERGGIETKEFGSYLFGALDVPAIESSDSKMVPYDSSRSLQLNSEHPVVAVLLGFIDSKLKQVGAELVRKARDARKTEEVRRLAIEAEKLAEILNDDFRKVRERLLGIRAASSRSGAAGATFGDSQDSSDDLDDWVKGTRELGEVESSGGGEEGRGGEGRKPPNVTPRGERDPAGSTTVDPVGGSGSKRSRPRAVSRSSTATLERTKSGLATTPRR